MKLRISQWVAGLIVLSTGLCTWADVAPFKKSFYTEIKSSKCMELDNNEWHGEPGDWFVQECPGFAGYRVIKKGGDSRSWYELQFNGSKINLMNDILNRHSFGHFPNVKETMFEWRTEVQNAQARPYAAIFRVEAQHPVTMEMSSKLYVLRLNGGFGCLIGVRASNVAARDLADNLTKPCI